MSRSMNLNTRVNALNRLGEVLHNIINGNVGENDILARDSAAFREGLGRVNEANPWFVPEFTTLALRGIARMLGDLSETRLLEWYPSIPGPERKARRILVIAAGNFPAAGLHDMICVLLSGHRASVRLSSDDDVLLPLIWDLLLAIEPAFRNQLEFISDPPRSFQAVIATGSNNTGRYFEHYFGKYPSIIRGSRNSAAVIRGDESIAELKGLAGDICQYFGMGCRSVSKLYVPADFSFDGLIEVLQSDYGFLGDHHKFLNNYEYRKAIHMIGNESFIDTGFMLLREEEALASPIAVLHYEYYHDEIVLGERLVADSQKLQCLVSADAGIRGAIPPGSAQSPGFFDYADGADTLQFLTAL